MLVACLKHIPGAKHLRDVMSEGYLKKISSRYPDGVCWEPNFVVGKTSLPSIVNIHDLCHVRYPGLMPASRERWLNDGIEKTMSHASRIMTISRFMKAEIEAVYGLPASKIDLVRPGVSEIFRYRYSPVEFAGLRRKYNLPNHYLLSVGTLEPRKNLKGLLQAYLLLPQALRNKYPLVLVGCQGWQHAEADKIIRRLQRNSELIKLGYVDQCDLPLLYQGASAFAYVSFYEGFGMPVAEAMASGVPVITSAGTSMEEVAAGCAQLVDPNDVRSIADGLTRVLDDQPAMRRHCRQAVQVSEGYSWKLSADALLKVAGLARTNE
ncbi:MAG: glycosyltransferase family 4 protein [Pseudomonadales bacterium]|nr:glycosyltransferase family 4 protein [Pseudomonadales bacterium]